MKNEGERFIIGQNMGRDLYLQHVGRYLYASSFIAGKRVLDATCGSGFGSEILSRKASKVVGIDIDSEAIRYCNTHLKKPNLCFCQMDCHHLAFKNAFFDVVISFETIEHLYHPELFLQNLNSVMKNDGLLIISTPNRENFALYTKGRKNPFHIREFDLEEFKNIIKTQFELKHILGQRYFAKKDVPLVQKHVMKKIPYGPDSLLRRSVRLLLRTLFSEKIRNRFFLIPEVWANKCKVGDISPSKGIYLVGVLKKFNKRNSSLS